jgi:hypothetical protein
MFQKTSLNRPKARGDSRQALGVLEESGIPPEAPYIHFRARQGGSRSRFLVLKKVGDKSRDKPRQIPFPFL